MFRKLWKLTRANREQAFALLILPAFFFGTLPQTACICADGHREASCPMLAGRQTPRAVGNGCCAANGCQRHEDKGRSCCRATNWRPATEDCGSHGGLAATTNSCCHPVVEQAPPAVTVKKNQSIVQPFLMTNIGSTRSLIPAIDLWPAISSPIQAPPPLDVVIAYSHLTI
jgi:hypothetical protein